MNTDISKYISNNITTFSSIGVRIGPFDMLVKGEKYSISQPLYDLGAKARTDLSLISSPQKCISAFKYYLEWINPLVVNKNKITSNMTLHEHAVFAYLEMIKTMLSGSVFNDAELSITPVLRKQTVVGEKFDSKKRDGGDDWTFMGDTMTGLKRLDNVRDLLTDVIKNSIPGDYIETGVWRGGSSIFARAVITAFEEQENRSSYVCDSFAGLPPGERDLNPRDQNWDMTPYLEVPYEVVANNFIKHGLLDPNVIFVKGFFNDTMPPLSEKIKTLSIMRLDSDMYESTVDVLYHLYDKLSIGGYVIMDDWFGFPSRTACEDFFEVHSIDPEIVRIDNLSAYWKKTVDVSVEYWRYEQSKFKLEENKVQD